MAVLKSLKGVTIQIVDEKGDLFPEYIDDEAPVEQADAPVVSKYIEATTNQEFGIWLALSTQFPFNCPTIGFQIILDGCIVRQPVIRYETFKKQEKRWRLLVKGVKIVEAGERPHCVMHKFKFAEIQTTMDDDKLDQLQEDSTAMSRTGEIIVKVYRRTESVNKGPKIILNNVMDEKPTMVHEKALKGQAKSHGVQLGNGEAVTFSNHWVSDYLDGEDKPFASFIFKYRSRAALKSLLVIREPEAEAAGEADTPSGSEPSNPQGGAQSENNVTVRANTPAFAGIPGLNIEGLTPEQITILTEAAEKLRQGNAPPTPRSPGLFVDYEDSPPRATNHGVKREREDEDVKIKREDYDMIATNAESRKRRKMLQKMAVIDLTDDD